jgi:hypothetical protein
MTANAISINIDVGDQPYYVHGPGYWYDGAYWVWVPGHLGSASPCLVSRPLRGDAD